MNDSCIVCGKSILSKNRYPKTGKELPLNFLDIANCEACGLGFAVPRQSQEELDAFYQNGNFWQGVTESQTSLVHQKIQAKIRVQNHFNLLKSRSQIRILDVGAGQGHMKVFLDEFLPGCSIQYDFIEPDEKPAARILSQQSRIKSRRAYFATLEEQVYDFIFLNHVLEHVADPVEFMTHIVRSLKPEGYCYVETPHRDDRFKPNVFPHTLFFTKASYQALADRMSVRTKQIRTFGFHGDLATGAWTKMKTKVLSALFHLAVSLHFPWALIEMINRVIFRYNKDADGIWISWLFQKSNR